MNRIRDFVTSVSLTVCAAILSGGECCQAQDAPAAPTSKEFSEKYRESKDDRPLLEEAISVANKLLGADSRFVLQPSSAPTEARGKKVIPVFLGLPLDTESNTVAYVPEKENCVIVEAGELGLLSDVVGNGGPQAIKQPLVTCLAIVLLHETGHISLGHNGCTEGRTDKFVITKRVLKEAALDIRDRLESARIEMKQRTATNEPKKREARR